MADFVVIAEFSVAAQHKSAFLAACAIDAASSMADEPGCRQFDALTMADAPESVVLYEVYDDRSAFEAHLRTPHYAAFAEAVIRFGVATTQVRLLERQGA